VAEIALTPFETRMLREASVPQDIGTAYGVTREVYPESAPAYQHDLVCRSLRTLMQLRLIGLFKAPLEEGYSVELSDATLLSSAEAENEFALGPEHVQPEDAMVFFVATPLGLERLRNARPRGLAGS
jgi:hypothetical protein